VSGLSAKPIRDRHSLSHITTPTGRGFLHRSKERLVEALAVVEKLKNNLDDLHAKDLHYLSKCHEVRSMTLCAKLTFRAALMRSESRGFHFREDFTEQDDKNWLKWIIIKDDEGEMKLSTQPIPINEYKIKPDDSQQNVIHR
jgi:succinate dehydrogenase / fumarate reductase flavoprotein subunit